MTNKIDKNLIKRLLNSIKESQVRAVKGLMSKDNDFKLQSNTTLIAQLKKQGLKEKDLNILIEKLKKRRIRTQSGIAAVAVLVKSFPCPGECAYCPKETAIPQSYLKNEPAVMRAIRLKYNPYDQVQFRLKSLENNGHNPKKIELIIIGGNFSSIPKKYRSWHIANCFKAANDYPKKKAEINNKLRLELLDKRLEKEQKKNETTDYKIIGLTVETRPDWIDEKEAIYLRQLGCTRVELGAQAFDNKILEKNIRGHGIEETAEATKLLRDYGFKITYHFMPALPGSSPAKDVEMYKKMFSDPRFKPDQIKFYPTTVVAGSLLYDWWQNGEYKAYSDKQLKGLIIKCKAATPEYVRIVRLIRDIPADDIVAGNMITNLRQELQKEGVVCRCIRCREPKNNINNGKIKITKYETLGGKEYFAAVESKDGETLLGFGRLRISQDSKISKALIRELHIYGQLVPVGENKKVQHAGWGKKLVAEMEKIAKKNKAQNIAVISGVGVKEYYRKLAYKDGTTEETKTYLLKQLKKS